MNSFKGLFASGGLVPDPHRDGVAHTAAFLGDVERLRELLETHRRAFEPRGPQNWTPMVRYMKDSSLSAS
jgi:hypothetical protein